MRPANAELRAPVVPHAPPAQAAEAAEDAAAAECDVETVHAQPQGIGRARLLERVLHIDLRYCPKCGGGKPEIIAAILEHPVLQKASTCRCLHPPPPPKAAVRRKPAPPDQSAAYRDRGSPITVPSRRLSAPPYCLPVRMSTSTACTDPTSARPTV